MKSVFFICWYFLLIRGHKNPNGMKRKMLKINPKLNPLLNGIRLIFGLKNDSPNRDNLMYSLRVGIPTIFVSITHK